MTSEPSKEIDYAVRYIDGGVSIVPLKLDGSKGAAVPSWNPYRQRMARGEELNEWFVRRRHGIGIVCGPISGGLEVMDFDTAELWRPWKSLLPHDLQCRLTTVQTPGGWHVMYRCREYCGNRKLAMWEEPQSLSERDHQTRQGMNFETIGKGVRIETRGDGGYIVGFGSPHSVHPSGRMYMHFGGREPWRVLEVSPDERRLMWQAAMTFDCSTSRTSEAIKQARRKLYHQRHGQRQRSDEEPWTWFDLNGPPIINMLEGWQVHRELTDGYTVTRPGKTFGVSGKVTVNDQGEEILTVYSSSTGPLAPNNGKAYASYGRFNLLTITRFGGDRKEAAKYVRQLMRGARSK